MQIQTENDFWNWTHNVVIQETRAQNWYNGDAAYGLRGFLNDRNSRMMGYAILRQVRSQPNTCVIPVGMRKQNITSCVYYSEYIHEERGDFCTKWRRRASYIPDEECGWDEFSYKNSAELKSFPIVGKLDGYGGGGYVVKLQGRAEELSEKLKDLQQAEWTDHLTRAIFLEFSIYNANVNLFGLARIMFESIPGGG
ncbi:unnamed protein product, partial [Notodromas monacha]